MSRLVIGELPPVTAWPYTRRTKVIDGSRCDGQPRNNEDAFLCFWCFTPHCDRCGQCQIPDIWQDIWNQIKPILDKQGIESPTFHERACIDKIYPPIPPAWSQSAQQRQRNEIVQILKEARRNPGAFYQRVEQVEHVEPVFFRSIRALLDPQEAQVGTFHRDLSGSLSGNLSGRSWVSRSIIDAVADRQADRQRRIHDRQNLRAQTRWADELAGDPRDGTASDRHQGT